MLKKKGPMRKFDTEALEHVRERKQYGGQKCMMVCA